MFYAVACCRSVDILKNIFCILFFCLIHWCGISNAEYVCAGSLNLDSDNSCYAYCIMHIIYYIIHIIYVGADFWHNGWSFNNGSIISKKFILNMFLYNLNTCYLPDKTQKSSFGSRSQPTQTAKRMSITSKDFPLITVNFWLYVKTAGVSYYCIRYPFFK